MGRKRRGFGWTRDEDDPSGRPLPERESRRTNKEHRKVLEQLVARMLKCPAAQRRPLPLEPDVLDALDELAGLPGTPARRRQLLRVKGLLRDVDCEALEAALEGDTDHAQQMRVVERWRGRLLNDGDEGLQAFMEQYPGADRQQLRSLTRKAGGESSAAARARRQIFVLIRGLEEA